MSNNDSLLVEDIIVKSINGKRYEQIGNNLKHMLFAAFGPIDDDEVIYSHKTEGFIKPDLIVEINGVYKNISVKSGRAENVHNEILDNFIAFLREKGISEKTLLTIKRYHYGDGTTDGTGENRKNYYELMNEMKDDIDLANEELNYRKEFVLDVVYHCVFQGTSKDNPVVDAIYFGSKEYGIVATRKQIISHLRKRSFSFYDNLHIGPLHLRPHSRYSDREVVDERNRQRIIAYWPNLNADLDYISKRYNY